jgi:hypothetical protein
MLADMFSANQGAK